MYTIEAAHLCAWESACERAAFLLLYESSKKNEQTKRRKIVFNEID
jgi:hypothetical protein